MTQLTKNTSYKLNNGRTIPANGFGMYQTSQDEATKIVKHALMIGYRHFDTARAYENEEETAQGIASFLKENPWLKRSDVFYTTKVKDADQGYEEAKAAIELSLSKAQSIEYIDLILIHSPRTNREKRLGTWRALQEAVESGKVKSIGVSNFGIHHLEELLNWDGLKIKPVVNQVELHPWLPRKELCAYCKEKGILMEAWAPITRGKKFDDPDVQAIAKKHGCTPADVLIRWSWDQGFIVLVKTATVERIQTNYDVLDRVELDEDDKAKLDKPDSNEPSTGWDPTVYEG